MTTKWVVLFFAIQLLWCFTECKPEVTCNPEVGKKIYFDLSDLFTGAYDYNRTIELEEMNGTIYFNFCHPTYFHCKWEPRSTSYIYLVNEEQDLCFPLTAHPAVNYSLIDEDDPSLGLELTFLPAMNFSQFFNVSRHSIEMGILCDKESTELGALEYFELEEEETGIMLLTASFNGCPYTINDPIWDFMGRLSFMFFTLMVILGSLIAFFGGKMVKILIIFAIGFAVFWATMITLFSLFASEDSSLILEFMVFFLSGILAVIAVVFLANNEHVGPPLIGMWTGLLISMQIYLAAMALISYSSSAFALIMMMIVGGTVGAYLGDLNKNSKIFYILCSSFLGCWLCMRGLSIYLGGYPNVFEISKKRFVEGENIGVSYYLYLTGQILMNVIGFYMQFSVLREESMDEVNFSTGDDSFLPALPLDRQMNVSAPPRLQKLLQETELSEIANIKRSLAQTFDEHCSS